MSTADDAVDGLQPGAEDGGEFPRVGSGLLGQLQGDVGGPVAVLPVLGSLHQDGVRDSRLGKGDFAGGNGVFQAGGYGEGEFFGSHIPSLPGARHVRGIRGGMP